MTNTLTFENKTVFGDRFVWLARCTISGTETETIVTDLDHIDNIQATDLTDGSTDLVLDVTTTPGTISMTGADDGDVIDFQCIQFRWTMALTLTFNKMTVFGDRKVFLCRATFTSVTSGSVVTGLAHIDNLKLTNLTDNSRAVVADTTSTAGTIAFTGVTAADVIDIEAIQQRWG